MKTNLRNISKDCVLKDGQERKAPYENKMGGRNYRRIVTLLITAWIILGGLTGILISSSNSVVQAATIYTSGTNPVTHEIISGNYTFEVNDAGDSTSCEMRIDGLLIATMDDTSGSNPDWNYSFETSGFSDGWHTIRFDSIGGATGTDITSISVKFDNNGPVITNATTMYPQGQTTAKPGDMVTIQAKVVEPISSIMQ